MKNFSKTSRYGVGLCGTLLLCLSLQAQGQTQPSSSVDFSFDSQSSVQDFPESSSFSNVVSEPGSLAMVLLGLAGAVAITRYVKRKK